MRYVPFFSLCLLSLVVSTRFFPFVFFCVHSFFLFSFFLSFLFSLQSLCFGFWCVGVSLSLPAPLPSLSLLSGASPCPLRSRQRHAGCHSTSPPRQKAQMGQQEMKTQTPSLPLLPLLRPHLPPRASRVEALQWARMQEVLVKQARRRPKRGSRRG